MELQVKGILAENVGLVRGTFSPGFRGIFAIEVDS
jgi:hypothetical protein